MEIFMAGVDILQMFVGLIGGGLAVFGLIQTLMGWHEQNGVQRNAGIVMFICGGAIAVVAVRLIPMLKNIGAVTLVAFKILF